MSLLRRNKDKQLAAEKKLAARHAIVKMGVDRDVRDVYFHGLVFAAVANDDHIDESERARLLELGEALELTAEDVAEAMRCLTDMEDDAKMDVIEECARQLTNVEVAECFLKEFEEIWLLGGGNKDEFSEFRSQLVDWMGEDVCAVETAKETAAAESEAKRKAEEARVKAEQAMRIEKETQRAKDGFRTFGEDALRVVKELSFYDKVRVSCDDLGKLRDRLLGEGYGAVNFERTLNEIKVACVDTVPKAGTLKIKRDSKGSIKSVRLEYYPGGLSKKVLKDKDIRLCLRKDAVWKFIGLATVKRTLSERTVKFLNWLLDRTQSSELTDLCLHYFWACNVEWNYLGVLQDENATCDTGEGSVCLPGKGSDTRGPGEGVAKSVKSVAKSVSSGRSINHKKCVQCGACVAACPEGAIDNGFCIDVTRCSDCGACESVCPTEAISNG